MSMKWTRTDEGDTTTLRIEGVLNEATAHELDPVVNAIVAQQRRSVTLDLTDLSPSKARAWPYS